MSTFLDLWRQGYLLESTYGLNEDYFLVSQLFDEESKFWIDLKTFLLHDPVPFFEKAKETTDIVIKKIQEPFLSPKYLAYYTSFDVSLKLIENEEIWLRSAEL